MNGWAAAIIWMWPMWWMERVPFIGRNAQSKTGRCSGFRSGAPSMVSFSSMNLMIASLWPSV